MTNPEILSKLGRVADNEIFPAEAYTWQSAALREKAASWVTEVLPQMAINYLLYSLKNPPLLISGRASTPR